METDAGQSSALWLSEFESFGAVHFITAGLLAIFMVGASWLGCRWRVLSPAHEWRLRAVWAWSIIATQIVAIVYYAIPFDLGISIPLQLCDLAVWVAPFALLTRNRLLCTLLYFWGIGLSTQAFFTPVLVEGVASARFWFFWISHTQIVGSAIYAIAVLQYRPSWRDARNAYAVSLAYGAVVFVLNIALEVNYGYIGDTNPEQPTIIDKLGPWPGRVAILALIVLVDFVIAWAPWAVWSRLAKCEDDTAPETADA